LRLRGDHPTAGAVPCRAAWLGRSELPRHAAVRDRGDANVRGTFASDETASTSP
jgi:hypothetical protein